MNLSRLSRTIALMLAVFFSPAITGCSGSRPMTTAKEPRKLLFVGDSFTFYNGGVGNHVKKLAASAKAPKTLVADSETKGGATLKILWGRPSVHEKIRGGYDLVILQDDIPEYTEHTAKPFFDYAGRFDEEIRKAGSHTVLFMAWPYERLNWVTLPKIVRAHRELSAKLHIPVAPVGLAFERALAKRPALAMLGPDKEHESLHGTYLAASVIYATLFQESPVGCTYRPDGVSAEEAAFLQHIAWDTVQDWQNGK